MNRTFTSTDRQRLRAEQIASYGAEQRRLKAAGAERRAAMALHAAGEAIDHRLPARPRRPPAASGRSQHLR
jgi:hypothetical protein